MKPTWRTAALAAVAGAVGALAVAVPAAPAHAATTYTWVAGWDDQGDSLPGADHENWTTAANWSPVGVPGPDDDVVLTSAPAYHGVQSATTLLVPATTTVRSFRMTESEHGNVYLKGAGLTVSGSFEWLGGDIALPVTVAGTGRVGAGPYKSLTTDGGRAGALLVTGSLSIDSVGTDSDHALQLYASSTATSGIRVAQGGTLHLAGSNRVVGAVCCSAPVPVVVDGTLDAAGNTSFDALELDLHGTTQVAAGARVVSENGPARLGGGARYTGAGTLELRHTAPVDPQPDPTAAQGGVLMEGTGTLAAGAHLLLSDEAKLTGTGGFTGPGTVELASSASATGPEVFGDLTIGRGTMLRVTGPGTSALGVWDAKRSGYHGVLRLAGNATVERGSALLTKAGTTTTVGSGGRLSLAPATTLGGGDCCGQPARVDVAHGGTLAVLAGTGAPAKVVRADLRLAGTLQLAAAKRLVTEGYPVRVGGSLALTGRVGVAASRTVITGSKVTGSFGCVAPGGQAAVTGTTAVTVRGVVGHYPGCSTATSAMLGRRAVRKGHPASFKAKGAAKKVKKVLVEVTVTSPRARKTAKITVKGAPAFKARKGRTTSRYVVAKLAGHGHKKKVVLRSNSRKPARARVRVIGLLR